MKKGWIMLAVAALLLIAVYYINQTSSTESQQSQTRDARPVEGFLAPDFTLTDEQGEEVTLSQLRGKVVFLNFWASWCPPCKQEMPAIQKAYEKYGDQVVFYGVNITASDVKEDALTFMKSNQYEMPLLFDYDAEAASLYRTKYIPTSFFIDKNGVIQKRHEGPMNSKQIDSYLKKTIGEE